MELRIDLISVNRDALQPTLIFYIFLDYIQKIEAPLSVTGRVLSAHDTVLGNFYEGRIYNQETFEFGAFSNEETNQFNKSRQNSFRMALDVPLSQKALDYIENIREKDHQKRVILQLDYTIKYFTKNNSNSRTQSATLLKYSCGTKTQVISQSDWVNNYLSFLTGGNFLLLELAIPNKHTVHEEWIQLYERSFRRLEEMKSAIYYGDWQSVMQKGRQFYENLKIGDNKQGHDKFKKDFEILFLNDQHSPEGIQNLYDGIWKFFEYTSKFIHDKDKNGNLSPVPSATKEDAYFVYAIAVSLLNLIGKKLSSD